MHVFIYSIGYGSIPIDTFLVGWTSIYQLFWGSLGTRVLTHPPIMVNSWACSCMPMKGLVATSEQIDRTMKSNQHLVVTYKIILFLLGYLAIPRPSKYYPEKWCVSPIISVLSLFFGNIWRVYCRYYMVFTIFIYPGFLNSGDPQSSPEAFNTVVMVIHDNWMILG